MNQSSPPLTTRRFSHRFGPFWLLLFVFLSISLLTRLALLLKTGDAAEPGLMNILQMFCLGLAFDIIAASYFFIPLALFLFLVPNRVYRWPHFRWFLLAGTVVWIFIMLFNAVAEWTFWEEFGSRFNFIAVDYLLFTYEVIGNIRESYPVGPILGGLTLLSLLIAWGIRHWLWASHHVESRYASRAGWLLLLLAVPLLSFSLVDFRLKDQSANRYVNSLSGNGIYEFFAAAYNNELDYATFYHSLPLDQAFARLREQLPTRHFIQALLEADKAFAAGKPSFMQIMTTSNHRPFTYPEGRVDIPSKSGRYGGVKYTDWAIGDFIDRAASKPWFADTIFVIVADHCASSAGKSDIPVNRYHIPALFFSPRHIKVGEFDRLTSQIDLPPTLLGLLNFSYKSRFLGYDMYDLEVGRERAFLGTYQDLGYLRNGKLVKLDSRRGRAVFRPDFKDGSAEKLPDDPELENDAASWYQATAWAFGHGGLKWILQ